jgi:hypothetical protein
MLAFVYACGKIEEQKYVLGLSFTAGGQKLSQTTMYGENQAESHINRS